MAPEYVPDHLYARLFKPWILPESEWPLCREDWQRVDAICALPWKGHLLDVGSGDGTLAAMVLSRNPLAECVTAIEPDRHQHERALRHWGAWKIGMRADIPAGPFDGALCCEVLEHLTPDDGLALLTQIKAACKPGAMVCLTVPYDLGTRADYPGHVRRFHDNTFLTLIEAAGLSLMGYQAIPQGEPIWLMAVCHA